MQPRPANKQDGNLSWRLSVSSHRIELIATVAVDPSPRPCLGLSVSSHRIELIATSSLSQDFVFSHTFSILSSDRIDCNHLRTTPDLCNPALSVSSHRIELIATEDGLPQLIHPLPFSILSSDRIDCNRDRAAVWTNRDAFQYPLIGSN